jgi:hypothetical protein
MRLDSGFALRAPRNDGGSQVIAGPDATIAIPSLSFDLPRADIYAGAY